MAIEAKEKVKIVNEYGKNKKDTGSIEVQVALMTKRIDYLNKHLKEHSHDFHSRRGLLLIVGKRRKALNYLKKNNPEKYQEVISKLGLRK